MLRSGAAEALVSILSNEEDRLVDLAQKFISSFEFNDRICALTGTALLLGDGLLDHAQQIVAVWLLLSEGDATPIEEHPFYSSFVALEGAARATPNSVSPQMHEMIGCILSGVDVSSVGEQPVKLIMSDRFAMPAAGAKRDVVPTFVERVSPLILVEEGDGGGGDDALTQTELLLRLLQDEAYWESFCAPYAHFVPEVCPVFPGELLSIDSWDGPPCMFDEGVTVDSRAAAIALVVKATEVKLRPGEADSLIAEIKKDPMLVEEAKIPAVRMPPLIENNTDVAKEIVVVTAPKRPAILKTLINLDVTVATADVVKHFIMSKKAPQEFLEEYIANSTKTLLAIRDNQAMARKARLFCKMMGFVVQNGAQLTPKMTIDLNSFCEDPRAKGIKEAQELNTILLNDA